MDTVCTIPELSPLAGITLGELAARDLRKAQVLKQYGLDFCCGGKKTLQQACADKGLDLATLTEALENANQLPAGSMPDFRTWAPGFLAEYIEQVHHSYVRKALPDLVFYAHKVAKVHGADHPELIDINQIVAVVNEEMQLHMQKEEMVLFPYIKNPAQSAPFGSVEHPISVMEQEHETVGDALARIRELSNQYTLPEGACASYQFLFRLLEEFEQDLHIHVHLENNILFPRVKDLEKKQQL